ncbi:MAG: DUF3179 domain-containing protein [Pseudomonadota bacterium]
MKLKDLVAGVVLVASVYSTAVMPTESADAPAAQDFVQLFFLPPEKWPEKFEVMNAHWQPGYVPILIELLSLARAELAYELALTLRKKTGQPFGADANNWYVWWWQQEAVQASIYPDFKSMLYGRIDKKFEGYFSSDRTSNIRLDEVRWGGVRQDGIPPLRQPEMITAAEAHYLADDNVVFGIEINGDARAYPKRILAWHEMFIDEIGGTEFTGVYCTLCGAVILYKTHFNGVRHRLGTSGFLYRSNKLMYDRDTQSLWNTTWGEPVIGPLADDDIRLERSYLVTTTWGEWKRRHPGTRVLSLETGHQRDYGEGVAYRDYFSTDELMFAISTSDNRLNNKDEVLALTFPEYGADTMAISAKFLRANPVYTNSLGDLDFIVLTDNSGANRVYAREGVDIVKYDGEDTATDQDGQVWSVSEDQLSGGGASLPRLPAHRAFWFGWHAAHQDTILIK